MVLHKFILGTGIKNEFQSNLCIPTKILHKCNVSYLFYCGFTTSKVTRKDTSPNTGERNDNTYNYGRCQKDPIAIGKLVSIAKSFF